MENERWKLKTFAVDITPSFNQQTSLVKSEKAAIWRNQAVCSLFFIYKKAEFEWAMCE